eukprot:1094254-Pyramimonas_sp.AAC.1
MIDALSITPLLYQGEHRVWLSFSFLRSYRVIMAYIRLEATGFLDSGAGLHHRGCEVCNVPVHASRGDVHTGGARRLFVAGGLVHRNGHGRDLHVPDVLLDDDHHLHRR